MRKTVVVTIFTILASLLCVSSLAAQPLSIDHNYASLDGLSAERIEAAKNNLHIAYGHTSHGSQLITGMTGLVQFRGEDYAFAPGGSHNVLDLRDTPFSGAYDLGNPDRTSWESATRNYLESTQDINVIIWSWCGQVSSSKESDIETYLSLMTGLESDYPDVVFVYMTGHLDGSGAGGNLHLRNEQIREYCRDNGKILYDFADIESWNPDGGYFLDKLANDNCDYDSSGDGNRDANWATAWQDAHPGEWYSCSSAHSQPLNANRKAYAAWQLWAALAERFSPLDSQRIKTRPQAVTLLENFPNPFNALTTIPVQIGRESHVVLSVYNSGGQLVKTLADEFLLPGRRCYIWDGSDHQGQPVSTGLYFYRIASEENSVQSSKMLYVK